MVAALDWSDWSTEAFLFSIGILREIFIFGDRRNQSHPIVITIVLVAPPVAQNRLSSAQQQKKNDKMFIAVYFDRHAPFHSSIRIVPANNKITHKSERFCEKPRNSNIVANGSHSFFFFWRCMTRRSIMLCATEVFSHGFFVLVTALGVVSSRAQLCAYVLRICSFECNERKKK